MKKVIKNHKKIRKSEVKRFFSRGQLSNTRSICEIFRFHQRCLQLLDNTLHFTLTKIMKDYLKLHFFCPWKVLRQSDLKYSAISTFSKFRLWWALLIVDTLRTPEPECFKKPILNKCLKSEGLNTFITYPIEP